MGEYEALCDAIQSARGLVLINATPPSNFSLTFFKLSCGKRNACPTPYSSSLVRKMEQDGKLSDSSGRAKRGRRFWIELDKSGNLDFIFALLLLCAVHHCVVFYWPNTWNRLTVFKFWALNQFKRDIAITPGFYKPLKKKAETSWNSPYCQRNWHFCVRFDMSNQNWSWEKKLFISLVCYICRRLQFVHNIFYHMKIRQIFNCAVSHQGLIFWESSIFQEKIEQRNKPCNNCF